MIDFYFEMCKHVSKCLIPADVPCERNFAADPVSWSFVSFVQGEVVSYVILLWIDVDRVAVTFKLNRALCKPEDISFQ